jgi:prepilin peptidase CpaA
MLVTVLLLALVSVAAYCDMRWHKVFNWTTYPGIAAGLLLHGIGSALEALDAADAERLKAWGWVGVEWSAAGLGVCGFIMLVCFVLFRIGGGDVKLMAMLGAVLGLEQGMEAMLWTFVLGGCVGLIVLVWRVGPWRLLVRVCRQVVCSLRIGGWSPLTPDERAQLQPPLFLAPCALAAVVIVRFGLDKYLPF